MRMPGFTAEAACRKRSGCYHQKAGGAGGSRNGARILPAVRTKLYGPKAVKGLCANGGAFWPQGGTTSTYGCMRADGSGIVCGGVTAEQQNSCDTF
jgi:hypothetical protein